MGEKTYLTVITIWGVLLTSYLIATLSSCDLSLFDFSFDQYVYVTPYGEKYHYFECFYIDDADYLTEYDNYMEAERYGYGSCSRCGDNNYNIYTRIDIKLDNR